MAYIRVAVRVAVMDTKLQYPEEGYPLLLELSSKLSKLTRVQMKLREF